MKRVLVIIVMIIFIIKSYGDEIVIYPNYNGLGDKSYAFQVLKLALSKADEEYTVIQSNDIVNHERAFDFLDRGRFSVVDSGIGESLEKKADAVYIPIDRGLLGYRLFIINKDKISKFEKINSLDDLRKLTAGQQNGWEDIRVLNGSDINVEETVSIESLMKMINKKRYDFLPLGIDEIHGFYDEYSKKLTNTTIEKTIVLIYPFGRFFYVKKGNEKLKHAIQQGLERAFTDGSFQKLFESHPFIKEGLAIANIDKRKSIYLKNYGLSEEFMKIESKWWYKF